MRFIADGSSYVEVKREFRENRKLYPQLYDLIGDRILPEPLFRFLPEWEGHSIMVKPGDLPYVEQRSFRELRQRLIP